VTGELNNHNGMREKRGKMPEKIEFIGTCNEKKRQRGVLQILYRKTRKESTHLLFMNDKNCSQEEYREKKGRTPLLKGERVASWLPERG